ncbi:hypothetical protein F511_02339 [Dorcoceras hygrometricum]|uniref:Uncharacterized protein n=1 Tax=Dorcoceras hygrometricum TaxID=472368 RepID=A0A2Z7CLV1_9LAMI|nr:hypothetical protein F511_02339 [Dorcoceras hygrometricum]
MENRDFPVRSTSISLDVQGNETEIIISGYGDHVLVLATQIGSMGTILHARKEEGLTVDATFNVAVVFGKRNEPMLVACARQIIQHISDTGSSKALVLSLGLRNHSMETIKAIVSAVTEKLPEVT